MEKSDALLLRLHPFSDTSTIVTWCTRDHGVIKTMAKGARRPKSPFAGTIDLFFSCDIVWSRSRRSDLHTLTESRMNSPRLEIRRSYLQTVAASYFCDCISHAVEPDSPVPELHDLLTRALDFLDRGPVTATAVTHFERELARALGLAPLDAPTPHAQISRSLADHLTRIPRQRKELEAHLDLTALY